jgi:sugar/nucleoside kinase (ribokinase family)
MATAGSGILLHLPQEGRGAGLIDKARAYEMQFKESLDTYDAYVGLGLVPDSRDYADAIEILTDLGVRSIDLLTNNPNKLKAVRAANLIARQSPLLAPRTVANSSYLRTKQVKLGHDMGMTPIESLEASPRCVVVGAAVVDHVFQSDRTPKTTGGVVQAHAYERRPGGKGLNQAIALSRLGLVVSLMSVFGNDRDYDLIVDVLQNEGVRPMQSARGGYGRSPQTAVIQPKTSNPVFIGWLGAEDRTLRSEMVHQHRHALENTDALLMTLEASEDALRTAIVAAGDQVLTVLTASPRAEGSYTVATEILEATSLIIGSASELLSLVNTTQRQLNESGHSSVGRRLMAVTGSTVIQTDFLRPDRRVKVYFPGETRVLTAYSPEVRFAASTRAGITSAIGNTDAFVAGAITAILHRSALDSHSHALESPQVSTKSVIKKRTRDLTVEVVAEALRTAMCVEAWVARTWGGFPQFPYANVAFKEWCVAHPPRIELSAK